MQLFFEILCIFIIVIGTLWLFSFEKAINFLIGLAVLFGLIVFLGYLLSIGMKLGGV